MKIHLLSDLHLEYDGAFTPPPVEANVLVLAGDIHWGERGIRWARAHYPDQVILFVPGNHEYYGGHLSDTGEEMRQAAKEEKVIYLDRDFFIYQGVLFLGCTLWTDFALYGDSAQQAASAQHAGMRLNDFSQIGISTSGGERLLSPYDTIQLHERDKDWVTGHLVLHKRLTTTAALSTPQMKPQRAVVITHHAPTVKAIAPHYDGDNLTPAFVSEMDPLIASLSPDAWLFGHTHHPIDTYVGGTRMVSNPRGYTGMESPLFDPSLVIEIPIP